MSLIGLHLQIGNHIQILAELELNLHFLSFYEQLIEISLVSFHNFIVSLKESNEVISIILGVNLWSYEGNSQTGHRMVIIIALG